MLNPLVRHQTLKRALVIVDEFWAAPELSKRLREINSGAAIMQMIDGSVAPGHSV